MVDHRRHYVLLTAACNEERFITRTIEAVIAQTQRPARWVIASDGSTDRTDEIVRGFCSRYEFIELLHVRKGRESRSPVQSESSAAWVSRAEECGIRAYR